MDELQAFVEHGEEEQALEQEFRARSAAFIEENEGALKDSIDAYYQSCIDNVDTYLDWYYSPGTEFAKFFRFFGSISEDTVVSEFEEGVIEPVDRTSVVDSYANYVGGLKSIYSEYCLEKAANDTDAAFQVPTAEERFSGVSDYPTLWPMWESDARTIIVSSVLADANSSADKDATKSKIIGYIESERDTLLALVDYATSRLQ